MENEEQIIKRNWFERFVLWCMNLLLKPFGKQLTGKAADAFLQFVKFALVGVSNTIVSYIINAVTLLFLDAIGGFEGVDKYIGNTVAFFLSVIWAFIWSNKFVFKEEEGAQKRVWWKTLIKTYIAYAFTGLVLSNVISYVCVDLLMINKYIAPIINLVIAVPINFVMNKFWAYKQKKGDDNEPENQPA